MKSLRRNSRRLHRVVKRLHLILALEDETHEALRVAKGKLTWEEYLIKPKLEEIKQEAEKS